jgi:hypothetical protein
MPPALMTEEKRFAGLDEKLLEKHDWAVSEPAALPVHWVPLGEWPRMCTAGWKHAMTE